MGKAKCTLVDRILTPYFFTKNFIRRELIRRGIRQSIIRDLVIKKGNTLKKNSH